MVRSRGGLREAHVPTEQPSPCQQARLPQPDEHPCRAGRVEGSPRQGPPQPVGLIWRIRERPPSASGPRGQADPGRSAVVHVPPRSICVATTGGLRARPRPRTGRRPQPCAPPAAAPRCATARYLPGCTWSAHSPSSHNGPQANCCSTSTGWSRPFGRDRTHQRLSAGVRGPPSPCRFTPSCSAYGSRPSTVHGTLRGSWLTRASLRSLPTVRPVRVGPGPRTKEVHSMIAGLFEPPAAAGLVLRPHQQLHPRHLDDRPRRDADHRAAGAEEHQGHARDAEAAAGDAQAAAGAPRRPPEAQRRDDEAVPAAQGQPAGLVLPAAAAVPGVHHHVPGAARAHRQERRRAPGSRVHPALRLDERRSCTSRLVGKNEMLAWGLDLSKRPDRDDRRVVRQGLRLRPARRRPRRAVLRAAEDGGRASAVGADHVADAAEADAVPAGGVRRVPGLLPHRPRHLLHGPGDLPHRPAVLHHPQVLQGRASLGHQAQAAGERAREIAKKDGGGGGLFAQAKRDLASAKQGPAKQTQRRQSGRRPSRLRANHPPPRRSASG